MIDEQIRDLALSVNLALHKNCQIIQNYFLSAMRYKNEQNIKKYSKQYHSFLSRHAFFYYHMIVSSILDYSFHMFYSINILGLSTQLIQGHYPNILLLRFSEDKKIAHKQSFDVFVNQKILNKRFIRQCGHIIERFVQNNTFDKKTH